MPVPFINRELSWVEFNQRVLNEALRPDLPLLERVKFLAITASNLDEFFQVRIGGLTMLKRRGVKKPDDSGLSPARALSALRKRLLQMTEDQYSLWNNDLIPALEKSGIRLVSPDQLSASQAAHADSTFENLIFPLLTPLAISTEEILPIVPAQQPIVACRLSEPASETPRYVLIPVPDTLGRFISLPDNDSTKSLLLVEQLVAHRSASLFPGETVDATAIFRVTRNGDIIVDDEDSADLADEMEDMLTARRFSDTIRLELSTGTPRDLANLIQHVTGSTAQELYRVPGPPGLASLFELVGLSDCDHLRDKPWTPQTPPALAPGVSMFETIAAGDLMLFHPYESFEPVVRLIEEAAADPDVVAIKQVLYRTAKKSRIIDALIRAAENGKHVTALVELKARFDEARNLDRADELQRAGAQIVYGVKGLKTHAKICLVIRREGNALRRYVHLGTGNYNEATARLYTDISYLTCKPDYGSDASLFFNAVSGRSKLLRFQRLVPAPTAMKPRILELITGETDRAKLGMPAKITAKINSLQDPDVIAALYAASRAGVEIRLNVRGICCLKAGDPKHSKNIEVISVIDRYLEHARIFHFHHGGNSQVFISSADWMTRNLEKRVELMIPIDEPALKRRIIRILDVFFHDNTQASRILPDGTSQRLERSKGQKSFRSQEHFQTQARQAAKDREHERAMTFEPHVPTS